MVSPMVLQFWQDARDQEQAEDVELALSRAGIDVTKAAYAMDLNPSQWTKQRQGVPGCHISLYRLARLGPEFWREYISIKAERLGYAVLKESELTAALLTVVQMARKPMAQMGRKAHAKKEHVA